MSERVHVPHEYGSYADGEHFKENSLLSRDEFTVVLTLYLDDFEIANPLETSKVKHKICAVYWVIANIAAKYRSTLNSIQLALLCNTSTINSMAMREFCDLLSMILSHLNIMVSM